MAATVAPFWGRGEMPRPKVAMRRIKEVLRLKEGLGLSDTAVSRSVRIARSTVKEYLDRAAAAGLNWETVAELSEEELDRRLFAAVDTRQLDRPLPDWEAVEKELRGRGVTLRLLWLEYLSRHPEGYRHTQFCAHFHAWQRHSRPPTMRRQHRAGEALEVDYAGMTLSVIDKGVVRQAQVFVACLPCSDLSYAEASWTQGHEDWLGAHVRAFAYIGGCPKKVIPDNLKTGVTDANYWDPVLNRLSRARPPLQRSDCPGTGQKATGQTVRGTRKGLGERDDEAPSDCCDRVGDVPFGSDRRRLWVGNRREWQIPRAARRNVVQRGR